MRVNPQVRREAELFTDGPVTDDILHAMACAHGLPLHRVPTTFEARPKRGYDVESLRALVRVAERRRDDALAGRTDGGAGPAGEGTAVMMLHYHGTPITPVDALYQLAGRCFCVSHIRPDDVTRVHQIGQSVMLDNGAFSGVSSATQQALAQSRLGCAAGYQTSCVQAIVFQQQADQEQRESAAVGAGVLGVLLLGVDAYAASRF